MPRELTLNPQDSFTFFPLSAHVAGGGDLLVVGRARRFEDIARYSFRVLAYRFDPATVRAQNLAPFLEFFDIARIEQAGLLRGLYNRVLFDFVGREQDSVLVAKPDETRDFLRRLADRWPYFFYAQHLPVPGTFLRDVAFSIVRRRRKTDGDSVPADVRSVWFAKLMQPCGPLFDRLPLTGARGNERAQLLLDALSDPGAPVPDAATDPNRATIVSQARPAFALVACLESIFRDVGWLLPQQELWDRATAGTDEETAPTASLAPLLAELGFALRQIALEAVIPEHRVTAFRQALARFRGSHFLLFTREPGQAPGPAGCVRLLMTSPVLRMMNPDGGKIETWSEADIRDRVFAIVVIMPLDYARAYPDGGPARDASFSLPVETQLPASVPSLAEAPEAARADLIAKMRGVLGQAPAEPYTNPVTGLVVPPLGELVDVVVHEDVFPEVDRQLRDGDERVTRQAYDRLVLQGMDLETARELLVRIYALCLRDAQASREPLDLDRYRREITTLSGGQWPDQPPTG